MASYIGGYASRLRLRLYLLNDGDQQQALRITVP